MHRVGTTWRMTDNLTWHTAMEIFDGPAPATTAAGATRTAW
jgi:hypothetical protein